MPLETPLRIVKSAFAADPSISTGDRTLLFKLVRDGPPAQAAPAAPEPERILRRAEAARRMGCSLRAIDLWSRQGLLQKIRLPGRVRCAGFRERDLAALIAGKPAA